MPEPLYLDPELAAKADTLFRELGLDLSTAVQLFLRQALREHGLPFTPRLVAPAQTPTTEKGSPQEEAQRKEQETTAPPSTPTPCREKEEACSALPEEGMDMEETAEEAPAPNVVQETDETENIPESPSFAATDREETSPFAPGGGDELRQAFLKARLIGAPLRRVRSLNRLYAIGEPNAHVKGWREVYVSGDEPFALDFGAVRVELGFHGGGSLRMMDGRLPDSVLEADAVYPRDLSAVFSSVIGQPLADVSSSRVWDEGQERERLSLRFANGCTLTFAPGNDWGALWLSDAHGSVMFAPDAVWLRVLDDRTWNGLR